MKLLWSSILENPFLWIYLTGIFFALFLINTLRRGIKKKKPGIPSIVFLSCGFLSIALGILFSPDLPVISGNPGWLLALAGSAVFGGLFSFFPKTSLSILVIVIALLYAGLYSFLVSYPALRIDENSTSLFVLRLDETDLSVEIKQQDYSAVYRLEGDGIYLEGEMITVSEFVPFSFISTSKEAVFIKSVGSSESDDLQSVRAVRTKEGNETILPYVTKLLKKIRIITVVKTEPAFRKLHLLKSYKVEYRKGKLEISPLSFSG